MHAGRRRLSISALSLAVATWLHGVQVDRRGHLSGYIKDFIASLPTGGMPSKWRSFQLIWRICSCVSGTSPRPRSSPSAQHRRPATPGPHTQSSVGCHTSADRRQQVCSALMSPARSYIAFDLTTCTYGDHVNAGCCYRLSTIPRPPIGACHLKLIFVSSQQERQVRWCWK
jgi:hypothetical protein